MGILEGYLTAFDIFHQHTNVRAELFTLMDKDKSKLKIMDDKVKENFEYSIHL